MILFLYSLLFASLFNCNFIGSDCEYSKACIPSVNTTPPPPKKQPIKISHFDEKPKASMTCNPLLVVILLVVGLQDDWLYIEPGGEVLDAGVVVVGVGVGVAVNTA